MNYQEYRKFRDQYLVKNSPLRLDCMNPVRSLEFIFQDKPDFVIGQKASKDNAIDFLCEYMGLSSQKRSIILGDGVRDLLEKILKYESLNNSKVFLPSDVYPVYWDLAKRMGYECVGYDTFPQFQLLSVLPNSQCNLLVIPLPLMPVGRHLDDAEIFSLLQWLKSDKKNKIIIDGVYLFQKGLDRSILCLMETGQCYFLHSLSKSWLFPEALGIAVVPRGVPMPKTRSSLKIDDAFLRMSRYPNAPEELQNLFSLQWKKFKLILQKIDPEWSPPKTGYFSVFNKSFETLLEKHGIMSVPASVFGSSSKSSSVIACLFYGNKNPLKAEHDE